MGNSGIRNEYVFIDNIHGKTLRELNFLLQELILYLFPNCNNNTVIECYKNIEYEKGDICIKVGEKIKYVSIKMGHKNSVHCESLNKFICFLRDNNVSEDIIYEILKYQYADGTIDGSGTFRKSTSDYKVENCNSIREINKQINNLDLLRKIINRFIIKGTQPQLNKIDVLVYGTVNDFLFISRDEIYNYILSKSNIESSSIHFSCLTFQPLSRNLNYNKKTEYMRHWIQIKWYNLEDNIIELMNERTKYLNK